MTPLVEQMTFPLLVGAWMALAGDAMAGAAAGSTVSGNVERGARVFGGACIVCHTVEAGNHRTGPSLATVIGHKAGAAEGFQRYSPALKASGIVWNEKTLDAWLRDPAALVPGNAMTFAGLPSAPERADVIAFLKTVSEGKAPGGAATRTPPLPDLKQVDAAHRITAIRYCADTYHLTTGDGQTRPYWEFNLRFKTDSTPRGPAKGQPALVGAGMGGDRAQVVFAHPAEMSAFVNSRCE